MVCIIEHVKELNLVSRCERLVFSDAERMYNVGLFFLLHKTTNLNLPLLQLYYDIRTKTMTPHIVLPNNHRY